MSLRKEYGHFAILGAGVIMLGIAIKRKPRKPEDRTGESCTPDDNAPFGYQCGQVRGGWELREEQDQFTGYGPFINRTAVDEALASLGFPDGNLEAFQGYMSLTYGRNLRTDGVVDRISMLALREASRMLSRGEWFPPRETGVL